MAFFCEADGWLKLQLSSSLSPKMHAETCFQYTQSLSKGKKEPNLKVISMNTCSSTVDQVFLKMTNILRLIFEFFTTDLASFACWAQLNMP